MYQYSLGLYEKAMPDSMSLEDKLLAAKEIGFDHMELCIDLHPQREARLDWSKKERAYWRSFLYEHDIPLTTLSLSVIRKCPLGLSGKEENTLAFELIEKGAKLAFDLGSRVMLMNGYDVFSQPSTPDTVGRFLKNLPEAVRICERHGVTLALENAEMAFCDTVAKAAKYVRYIDSPFFQIYADIGNITNSVDGDTDRALADLVCGSGCIAAMHLKDSLPGEYRYTPYSQGHVDFKRMVAAAKQMGVRLFTAELFYKEDSDFKAEAIRVHKFLKGFLDEPHKAETNTQGLWARNQVSGIV